MPRYNTLAQRPALGAVSYVPPELVDMIFSYLLPDGLPPEETTNTTSFSARNEVENGNRVHPIGETIENRDLRSCGLVSRAWNAIARPYIYRNAVFVGRIVKRGRPTIGTFSEIQDFLRLDPQVCNYIQRLRLELPNNYANGTALPVKIERHVLHQFLSSLPNLQHLHLVNIGVVMPTGNNTPLSIRSLHISYLDSPYSFRNMHDIEYMRLLCLFNRVQELHLTGLRIPLNHSGRRAQCDDTHPLEIERLIIERSENGRGLSQHLRKTMHKNTIRVLTVRLIGSLNSQDMLHEPAFQSHVGANIQELNVYLSAYPSRTVRHSIDITAFPNVRKLTLGLRFFSSTPAALHRDLYKVLISIPASYRRNSPPASHVSNPHLSELVIVLPLRSLDAFSATALVSDIPEKRIPNAEERLLKVIEAFKLKTVTFECIVAGPGDTEAVIRDVFPMLDSLGLLRINVIRPSEWTQYVDTVTSA